MEKRIFKKSGKAVSLLGMGGMRFPAFENGDIDVKKAEEIIDYAYTNGVNYYDTAYIYHDGKSESFVGNALKKYPRSSYFIADKLPIWVTKTKDDVEKLFETQLERCGVDYFDFYLCHALDDERYPKVKEFMVPEFLFEKKKEGKIKHIGFSFHGSLENLKEIIADYPWEFCQLQINYFDWEFQKAKEQYEICEQNGLQVIVMEPVRGGILSDLGELANEYLKEVNPGRSISSWAIRFAMQQENVLTVLSGMSNLEQLKDNLNTASRIIKLTDDEREALDKALDEYKKSKLISCTGCNYCVGCPVGIDIKSIFKVYNKNAFSRSRVGFKKDYAEMENENKADKCIKCGKCAKVCPQRIDIPGEMERILKIVEG